MAETAYIEEVEQDQQPDPIPKKKVKVKEFAAKIKLKYPDYKDVDDLELTNKIIAKYPEYKDQVDLTPEVKKKSGSVDFSESSLQAGNALSQSNGVDGEEIQTIEMYTTPQGEMIVANPFSLSKKFNELSNKTKQVSMPSSGKGGQLLTETPDEEAKKSAKKLQEDFKDLDLGGIYEETKDIPEEILQRVGAELLEDRKNNSPLYQRKLANIKWRDRFENKLIDDVDKGNITPENYNRLQQSINRLPEFTGSGDFSNQRGAIQSLAKDIQIYGGENRDKILQNFAVEVSKVYGNAYNNNFDKTIQDSPEGKYLNADEQLALQYIKDVSPEKAAQYDRVMIDPKTLKNNPDAERGYNHLRQTLEETGIALQQNSVTEELNNLKSIATKYGGLTDEQLTKATELEKKQDELTQKKNELDQKYPDRIEDKVDDALQEIMGQRTSGLNYFGGTGYNAIKNTAQGVWEAVSSPFMSDASNAMRELSIMGETLEENKIYRKTDENKALVTDTMVIEPELQKQIDLVKNNGVLSNDQKEMKIYQLLKQNTDKFGRVPIKGGKFNINPSSIMYSLSDLGTSLLPFIALEAATGGGATAGLARKFASTFTAAAATTFHDEYASALLSGKSQSEAYKEAMGMTAISSFAMAGANTPSKIKAMLNPKTSAGKLILSMSDDAIQKILDKGLPKGLKGIGQTIKDRAKAVPQQFKQGLKTGAEFEVAMNLGNELKSEIYDTEIDREQNFKQSLLGIANFGIMGAGLGQIGFKSPTELQKSTLLQFGEKPKEYISVLDELRKEGKVTPAEYDHRKQLIESSEKAYQALPSSLNEKQKSEYLYQTVIKNEASKGKSELPPKQAAEAEKTALVADHTRGLILEEPTDKQLEDRKGVLERKLEPKKDAEGKVIEIPEKEKLDMQAELEAIDNTIASKPKEVKGTPEEISQPIELSTETPKGKNVVTEKGKMEGVVTDNIEVNDESVSLPSKGFLISDVTLNEGEPKGKGSGQEIYKKALDEYGTLYSVSPVSEDALRVQDKLVEKGIAKIENITLSDGTEVRKITKSGKDVVEPTQEQQMKDIKEGNMVTFTYKSDAEVPEIFKDKISSRGETNGEPVIRVTIPKSLADYHLAKEGGKQDVVVDEGVKPVKKGVEDIVSKNKSISDIGTKEEYSEYLDTIFPDSKVKDIVYHGTDQPFETFNTVRPNKMFGASFTTDLKTAENYTKKNKSGGEPRVIATILDVKNPKNVSYEEASFIKEKPTENDAYIDNTKDGLNHDEYVVFEPKQIHILGSKADIEGFKKWKEQKSKPEIKNEEAQVTEDTIPPTKEVIEQPVVSEVAPEAGGGKEPPIKDIEIVENIEGRDLSGIRKKLVSEKVIEGIDLNRVSDKEMMAMGRKILDTGEIKPEKLVTKIVTEGKGVLTPTEVVGLITYKRDIDNSLQDTYKKINERKGAGEDIGTLGVEAANLERKKTDFEIMSVITAQQQSMAFRLRQRMLDNEYNVVTQIEKYKANNNGKIPADVEAKFVELGKQLEEVKSKLAEAEKLVLEKEGKEAIDNISESLNRENKYTEEELEKKVNEGVESEISKLFEQLPSEKRSYADKAIEALEKFRKNIRNKTYESTLGIPVAIADLGAVTAIRAIKVGKSVAEAVRIGIDRIKKELDKKGIKKWEKEKEYREDLEKLLESEGVSIKKIIDKPTMNEDGTVKIPNQMLRDLVQGGIKDIEGLTDAVHKQVVKDLPDVSKRQVRDYITEYGKEVNKTADEIQTQVNTAKRVGRLLSELEDLKKMNKAQFLAKYQKLKPSENKISDRERELKRQIKALGKDIAVLDNSKPEAERIRIAKERVKTRIEDLNRKIKNKDFAKPVKKKAVTDTELVQLTTEKEKIQEQFDDLQFKNELKNRTFWKKAEDIAYEATSGLLRGLTLSLDLSAAGVQGLRRMFTNPKKSLNAQWEGLKHLASEKGAEQYLAKQKAQPYYPLLQASKLAIDDKSGKISAKEGMFISNWINFLWDKVVAPIGGVGTKAGTNFMRKINPYAASQRAYDGYINSIRIQSFIQFAKELERDGYTFESNPEVFKKAADFVNTTTGRGSLGAADTNSKWLNVFLTAPRKVISEVKLYTPYAFAYYARLPKAVRKKALLDFAKFTTTFLSANALLWASRKDWGNDEEDEKDNFWNMNSSDFLTHKIGDKRVSLGGGMKSILTFQARMLTGEFTDQYGKTTELGDRYGKPINTRLDLATRFAIGKAAPAFNVLAKKLDERKGLEIDNEEIIKNLSVPLWLQDVGELYKEDHATMGAFLTALSIFGANVRSVEEKNDSAKKQKKEKPKKPEKKTKD